MKRLIGLLLSAILLFSLTACGQGDHGGASASGDDMIELSLFASPVGNWGSEENVNALIARFNETYSYIHVTLTVLPEDGGDEFVDAAIESGRAPDILLSTPKSLWDNWGDEGMLSDLSVLWQSDSYAGTYDVVKSACVADNGAYFAVPVAIRPYCMAINYDMFEAADALQYIDERTHTWTADGFVQAVEALADNGVRDSVSVYCAGQGGDYGTRALVTNLYGGRFANEAHTAYAVNSEENCQALALLTDMEDVVFDPDIVGDDENLLFLKKKLAMSLCWDIDRDVEATATDFTIFPMAFPGDSEPSLPGEIWAFGIFNNEDAEKTDAAQLFVRFLTEDDGMYRRTVTTSTYWPVRAVSRMYEDDDLRSSYGVLAPYLGDYEQVTPGWATARTEWWNLLQRVGNGADPALETETFIKNTNAAIHG